MFPLLKIYENDDDKKFPWQWIQEIKKNLLRARESMKESLSENSYIIDITFTQLCGEEICLTTLWT